MWIKGKHLVCFTSYSSSNEVNSIYFNLHLKSFSQEIQFRLNILWYRAILIKSESSYVVLSSDWKAMGWSISFLLEARSVYLQATPNLS